MSQHDEFIRCQKCGISHAQNDCNIEAKPKNTDLATLLERLRRHRCSACGMTDEEWAHVGGWNAALDAVVAAALRENNHDK